MLIETYGWPIDVLEVLLENLESLWGDWLGARRSPEFTLESLGDLEERLTAHLDALVLAGEEALPLLRPCLTADWEASALAGAHTMLLLGDPEVNGEVWEAFLSDGDPAARSGILLALRYGPPDAAEGRLRDAAGEDDPTLSLPAAETLAMRGSSVPPALRPREFVDHADPAVRASAWRVLAATGSPAVPTRESFLTAFADESEEVASASWLAAAWTRQPWLLVHCRARAAADIRSLAALAMLGGAEDAEAVLAAARNPALGPERFAALGSFGFPAVVETLVDAMADPDAVTAVAAARAYTRITGHDIFTDERAQLVSPGEEPEDEFEAEFVDEEFLPDPGRARDWWGDSGASFDEGQRHSQGAPLSGDMLEADLLSRRESAVRDRFAGEEPMPTDLDRFPLTSRLSG